MNSSMSQFSILKNSDLQEYSGGLNPTCGVLVGMSIYLGLTTFTGPVAFLISTGGLAAGSFVDNEKSN
ncbi:bacteriocin secretion protein [Streptococcus pneumoniae]|nr:bacteriocin secretion protein [Streptococcus pneumoniae]